MRTKYQKLHRDACIVAIVYACGAVFMLAITIMAAIHGCLWWVAICAAATGTMIMGAAVSAQDASVWKRRERQMREYRNRL